MLIHLLLMPLQCDCCKAPSYETADAGQPRPHARDVGVNHD